MQLEQKKTVAECSLLRQEQLNNKKSSTGQWGGGHTVAQLVEARHYELGGHGFDSQGCHWKFSLTQSFWLHYGPGVDTAAKRNITRNISWGVNAVGA